MATSILVISNHNSFRGCCLIKLFLYILFEKYIYILALEMASTGNQNCASCIGTLSFLIREYVLYSRRVVVSFAFRLNFTPLGGATTVCHIYNIYTLDSLYSVFYFYVVI